MVSFPEVVLRAYVSVCQILVATGNRSSSIHGAYSAEVSKTVFHLRHQLVPRQSSQTPTDQIEQLDAGMSRCAGGQQT